MHLPAPARTLITATAVCLTSLVPSWAQELVSVRNPTVNMRAGPGTDAEILWKLSQGYPLQVLDRKGDWLRVQDFEGDEGWIARSVTSGARYHIVKVKSANLRAGPGTQHKLIGNVSYGDLLRTTRRQGEWVQVRNPKGGNAWIASSLVWGW
jgi:SH3-like domain-containing protein